MDFGDKLKQLREENNLSRDDLAKNLNISYSTISKYETNVRFPDKDTLKKIADYFNVTIDYLLGRSNIRNPHIPEEYIQKHKVTKNDIKQYEDFIENASAFFMDDEVADEDKEKLFRDISELFWESKEINKKKYGRKKKKTDNG